MPPFPIPPEPRGNRAVRTVKPGSGLVAPTAQECEQPEATDQGSARLRDGDQREVVSVATAIVETPPTTEIVLMLGQVRRIGKGTGEDIRSVVEDEQQLGVDGGCAHKSPNEIEVSAEIARTVEADLVVGGTGGGH